jgi:hypothetical protein
MGCARFGGNFDLVSPKKLKTKDHQSKEAISRRAVRERGKYKTTDVKAL